MVYVVCMCVSVGFLQFACSMYMSEYRYLHCVVFVCMCVCCFLKKRQLATLPTPYPSGISLLWFLSTCQSVVLAEFIICFTALFHGLSLRKCEKTVKEEEEGEPPGGWEQRKTQVKQRDGKGNKEEEVATRWKPAKFGCSLRERLCT